MTDLEEMLIRHEGLRLKPYRCTAGKLTIGVGRNLEDVGVSESEALAMLRRDITEVQVRLINDERWCFGDLCHARQVVLANMCFQLGKAGLDKFRKLRAAVAAGDWEEAARQMLDSRWAKQTPRRAKELAEIMRTGELDATRAGVR